MNHTEWARVGQVAQSGFTKLLLQLVEQGANEQEAITILLSTAQLKAHAAGVIVEHAALPQEERRSLN